MMVLIAAVLALAPQEAGVRELLERLAGEDAGLRDAATARLVRLGASVEPDVRALLASPDIEVRGRARSILEEIRLHKLAATGLASSVDTKLGRRRTTWDNRAGLAPEGRHLVAQWPDLPARLAVVDLESGGIVRTLEPPWVDPEQTCPLHLFGVGTEGRVVGCGLLKKPTEAAYGELLLWDHRTGKLLRRHGFGSSTMLHAASPDGKRVIRSRNGRDLAVMDVASGASVPFAGPAADPAADPNVWHVYFGGDGARVVAYWSDRTARLYDVEATKEIGRYGGLGTGASGPPSPDGRHLVLPGDGSFRLVEIESGRTSPEIRLYLQTIVRYSRDGRDMIYVSGDVRRLSIEDAMAGRVGGRYAGDDPESFGQVTPDGRSVMACEGDGTIRFWDLAVGRETRVIRPPKAWLRSGAFSPDGRRLAVAMTDDTVRLWDVAAGREGLRLRGHANAVAHLAFSPDGGRIATAGADRSVRIWETATGRELLKLAGHGSPLRRLAYSGDGRTLVSSDLHSRIILWDAEAGSILRRMAPVDLEGWERCDQDHADAVGFLEGGRHVFLAGIRKIFVWDLETGDCLGDVYHDTQSTLFVPGPGRFAGGHRPLRQFEVVVAAGRPALRPGGAWRPHGRVEACAARDDLLAIGTERGRVELVHETRGLLRILDEEMDRRMAEREKDPFAFRPYPREEDGAGVMALHLSADGLTVTVFHEDGVLRVWRAGGVRAK